MELYITEFGAVADGVTKCTDAINETINKVAEAGGGYAIVPPGEYVSGTIELKSNVYLYLEPGATILGSMEIEDFRNTNRRISCKTLVLGDGLYNSGILGHGTLDLRRQNLGYTKEHGRPCLVVIVESENITLRGVSLINTGFFTIYSGNNKNVTFDSLIINSEGCENGDGIDFSGSKNVTISNCKVRAGDDAIGLKTHYGDAPCENFTITNCVLSSNWAGIRIGPETCGDMLNITVSNCVFNDCSDGIKVQLCENYHMEDLTFSNLNMNNVIRPIFFTSSSVPMGHSDGIRPDPGVFKRVLISNVIAHMNTRPEPGWFENHIFICGLPSAPIEDLMISNMHVVAPGGKKIDETNHSATVPELLRHTNYPDLIFGFEPFPSSCMYIRNAKRVRLFNCVFETKEADERPAIVAQAVDGLKMTQCDIMNCGGLLDHHAVSNLKMVDCEGAVTEPSDEYKALWDEFREKSVKLETEIYKNAKLVDRTNLMDKVFEATIPAEYSQEEMNNFKFNYEYSGGEAYLRCPAIVGSVKLIINNKVAYYFDRTAHGEYQFRVPFAHRIDEFLEKGENTIGFEFEGDYCGLKSNNILIMTPKAE